MAGHSHSKNIRLRKAAVDAKRSKIFSKMARLVTIAARHGGGDPKGNPKLAFAISKAKAVSLPKDTIDKAIKKGTGELGGENLEEVVYEGYGPGGVAIICEILTDNRNRTAPEIRKLFDIHGGKLGSTHCVAWMFHRKGQFLIEAAGQDEDRLTEIALEAGADDLRKSGDYFEILCDPANYEPIAAALESARVPVAESDLIQLAETLVRCDDATAPKVAKLLDALDDHDDVQSVYSNADLPEAVLAV